VCFLLYIKVINIIHTEFVDNLLILVNNNYLILIMLKFINIYLYIFFIF